MAMGRSLVALLAIAASLSIASARMPMHGAVGGGPDACQACLVSVRILEDFLCDPAATDFLVNFVDKQICPAVGDSIKCHNLAQGLLPTIIQWFRASATPASLCASAGVCGDVLVKANVLNEPSLRVVRDTAECAMCEFVVNRVKVALNDSATLERIKEAALQVCGNLPQELATSCTDFVNTYEPMIAELIESMDGEMVCAMLGVCLQASLSTPPPPLPPALVLAASRVLLTRPPPPPHVRMLMTAAAALQQAGAAAGPGMGMGMGMGMMMGHNGPRPVPFFGAPAPGGPLGDACDYCKMAVIQAHALVSNPTIQAEMVNYTKQVCDSFPSFADACKAYVDMYAPLVFTLLEQYLIPDTLCAQTGMCPPDPAAGASGMMMGLLPASETANRQQEGSPAHGCWVGRFVHGVSEGFGALARGFMGLFGVQHEGPGRAVVHPETDMHTDMMMRGEAPHGDMPHRGEGGMMGGRGGPQ